MSIYLCIVKSNYNYYDIKRTEIKINFQSQFVPQLINFSLNMKVFPMPSSVSAALAFTDAETVRRKQQNFYYSIKPIHTVSRFFGLLLFKVRITPDNRVEEGGVGVFNTFWFITIIIANLGLQYFVQTSPRSKATSESMLILSDRFLWTFELFMCLTSITLSMIDRKRFIKILQDVINLDNDVICFQFLRGYR